jgi:hypothetical protein
VRELQRVAAAKIYTTEKRLFRRAKQAYKGIITNFGNLEVIAKSRWRFHVTRLGIAPPPPSL